MKKLIAFVALVSLSGWTFAQSQVDVAVLTVAADVGAAYAGTAAKSGLLGSQKNSSIGATVTYTYTAKLDDANTVKAGVIADFSDPLVSGTDAAYQPQWAGKLDPFVQYQGFGVDAKTTFPLIDLSPGDKSGLNAGGAYQAVKNGVVTAAGFYPVASNTFVVGNYTKVTYKYAIDKTTSVSGGLESDLALVPSVFLADLLPQISGVYGPAQLDVKYDLYNTWVDNKSAAGATPTTQSYLEPKFTYDLGSVGVKGLKAYLAGRLALANTDASFGAAGSATAWHDSRVQPGVSYSTALEGVGTVGGDLSYRINRIDADTVANTKDAGKPSSGDLRVNLSYQIKF